ncbi:hypothetical protein IC229_33225 [Spirosoma sp. BT702]|uniref:Uncharacterized protein n=1 Tax=Spirosoma profusum TaxID=2771354 RepID=A0A927GAY9_9BACT|nr:hypothetical protein [Spirosoma profusum]MBD2705520.1 hypothetical protein [Spirosoma profusum]
MLETPAPPAPAPVAPPVQPAIDVPTAISVLQQAGHHVFQKGYAFDKEQAERDPFLGPILSKVIGDKVSEIGQRADQDVFESTGIPKQHKDEKWYEYMKRAAATLKEQAKANPDVKTIKDDYESRLSAKDQTIAEISLVNALGSLKLNVSEDALESQRELLTMRALSLPHRVEGRTIVFQKFADDGKTLIDVIDPTTGVAMEPKKFLEAQFKQFLKTEDPQPQGPGKPPKPADTNKKVPTTIDEIGAELLAEGFMPGPAFTAEVQKRQVQYAITK